MQTTAENNQSQMRKTGIFLAIAALALLLAWEPWRPAPVGASASGEVGDKLFSKFTDPLAAKSLEVITFDEDTASIRDFRVAQVNGVWSIPSHSNYPADAKEHMAQAATSLLDLEILGFVSKDPGDHELYGVIAPEPTKLKPGMVGVGTRVTMKDEKDNVLADLIVGKPDKDRPELRFVRAADRDQVYKVGVRTDKFSTKFEDWIEKDLLKLAAFDVREVELGDYSTQEGVRPDGSVGLGVLQRSRMKFNFDDTKSTWNLAEMAEFDQKGKAVPTNLADGEEIDPEKLNNLKTALDDLVIVDVERKPQGLSQDLRASEDFVRNREAVNSLAERGFYPINRNNQLEILSSEGEVFCTTKDGVRYVLRFGNVAGGGSKPDEVGPDGKPKSGGLNRYLFVMAQFDENQIPKPKLDPVPGEEAPAEENSEAAPADKGEQPADGEKTDADKPAAEKDNAEPKADGNAEKEVPETKTADDESGEAGAKEGEQTAEEPAAEKSAAEKGEAKPEAKAAEKPAEKKIEPPATPEEQQKIVIRKENQRKQDDYDAAIKKGQDKVKELNERFADWYFVISDDIYKKIHLGRTDVVKKKEAEGEKKGGLGEIKQFEGGLGAPPKE